MEQSKIIDTLETYQDALEPLPEETTGHELDKEEASEIDEHQP